MRCHPGPQMHNRQHNLSASRHATVGAKSWAHDRQTFPVPAESLDYYYISVMNRSNQHGQRTENPERHQEEALLTQKEKKAQKNAKKAGKEDFMSPTKK